jgi:predicted RNase H-like HicB family nuclease
MATKTSVPTQRFVATYELLEGGNWTGSVPEVAEDAPLVYAHAATLEEVQKLLHKAIQDILGKNVIIQDRVL